MTKVVTHMATRYLCLGGQVDILFDRQSASMPVAIGQATNHVMKYQLVRLGVCQIFGGREGQVDILFDRQSASQPAAIDQPTRHVTKYQPVRLGVGQICSGRRTGSPTTLGPSPRSQHSH